MINRILTTLDGSHRAELAVPYAAYVGAMLGARIELVTVAAKPGMVESELNEPVQRSLAEAEGLMGTWIKSIDTSIIDGDPAKAIVKHAGDSSTLIAMATHGRTGLVRRIVGSVAEGVLRMSNSPVMVIRGAENAANIRLPARVTNILVPLDMSEASEGSLSHASFLAEKLRASVTLLHVGDETKAAGYLDGVERYFDGKTSRITKQYRTGDAGREIVETAASLSTPLTVMCSVRSNAETGSIRGSVTDYVIRHSRTPVLVIPFAIS